MNIVENYYKIRNLIPENIEIVAVSKTKPASVIDELFLTTGHKVFGENKARELELKHDQLPKELTWHFIGHLQTNKIKYIAPFVGLIQSVDSYRLLLEVNKEAKKCNRVIPCLLQFHIACEETKFGFTPDEVNKMLDDRAFVDLSNISIHGVMGMATNTSDELLIRTEFKTLMKYFNTIKARYFSNQATFKEVSMGMTDDYMIAIDEGSTIVRIGSGIFGIRGSTDLH